MIFDKIKSPDDFVRAFYFIVLINLVHGNFFCASMLQRSNGVVFVPE